MYEAAERQTLLQEDRSLDWKSPGQRQCLVKSSQVKCHQVSISHSLSLSVSVSSCCFPDLCLNCPLLQTVQQSKCNLDLRVKLNFHNVVCILCKPGAMRISFFLDLER